MRGMVFNESGEVKTTSYAVADAFGKKHYNVLRDIDKLRCSENFKNPQSKKLKTLYRCSLLLFCWYSRRLRDLS